MYRVYVLFVAGLFFLLFSGCATAPVAGQSVNDVQIQSLKSRLDSIESESNKKDAEIGRLNEKIEHMKDSQMSIHQENFIMANGDDSSLAGVSIKKIQKALKSAGFYKGRIDGKMGGKTRRAIVKFQKVNKLSPDGAVGQSTWNKLRKYSK